MLAYVEACIARGEYAHAGIAFDRRREGLTSHTHDDETRAAPPGEAWAHAELERPSTGTEGAPTLVMLDSNTANDLIRPHMPVVCSDNGEFATVDHVEGRGYIKLTKDDSGQHHYIPLEWVTSVDDKVHIDRPGKQAMAEWMTTPPRQ